MGICSNLCASGLQLFQDRAGKFWEFEDRSKVIMRSIANWLQRHPDIEKITPETSLEIKQIIESYYDFATALNGFLGEQERAFINSTATHKFEDLYDEKIGEEVVTDVHLHEALFGALGDLLLFENLRFQFKVVSASDMFKEKLNEIEAGGQQGHYSRLVENLMSRAKRLRFSNTLEFLDDHSEKLDTLQGEGFLYLQALRQRLETHLAQDIRDSATFWGRIKGHFKKYFTKFDIRQHKRLNWTEYYLSKVFGNLAGSINVQKLIKSIPVEELQRVKAEVLQPGDVIVEKTTGAITDKFIPGHFGHVAVYIGRPEQLKGILLSDGSALLDHPKVKALIPELEAGATTMEAIRPGTRLEDISHWAITDLAVLRPQSYPKKHLGDVLLKAMSYSGTKYDFNFDVNTEAIVVCSELPYQTFRGINFRIAYKAGRWTISPDDVAILAGPDDSDVANRPLRLVYFNHETKEVEQAERFELYKTLVDVDSNYADAPENDHSYPELQ
jgi:hypothetical protein